MRLNGEKKTIKNNQKYWFGCSRWTDTFIQRDEQQIQIYDAYRLRPWHSKLLKELELTKTLHLNSQRPTSMYVLPLRERK